MSVTLATLILSGLCPAHAYVLYNTNGGQNQNGTDGQLPPTWVNSSNGAVPAFTGSMNVMWYVNLQPNDAPTLSTADAINNNGAPSNFQLFTGPGAWNNLIGHGLDYGLIHLNGPTDLTITVAADASASSQLRPGFSMYQGWDTGTTFDRTGLPYVNNVNDPLGTVGLTYLNQAFTTTPGGSASYTFTNLAAGDYTLMLGGSGGTGAVGGKYQVSFSVTSVPVPAAFWLLGSALAGIGITARRKDKGRA
jgi:hypothetical protein